MTSARERTFLREGPCSRACDLFQREGMRYLRSEITGVAWRATKGEPAAHLLGGRRAEALQAAGPCMCRLVRVATGDNGKQE